MASSDPRFAAKYTDPRFKKQAASKRKVVVDQRFAGLFQDEQGASSGKKGKNVDKYGRRRTEKDQGADDGGLKGYYQLASSSSKAASKETVAPELQSIIDRARGEGLEESSDEETDDEDDSEEEDEDVVLGRRVKQLSPGEVDLSEGSDLGEENPEEDEEEEDATEPTARVAIVNLDWDHLRAVDLYRVLASPLSSASLPSAAASAVPAPRSKGRKEGDEEELPIKLAIKHGRLLKLVIYPSQFGRERLEKEAQEGPPVAIFGDEDDGGARKKGAGLVLKRKEKRSRKRKEAEDITERDILDEQLAGGSDEEDYDNEALRRYQLERLRYYYAIATFDSAASAAHVVQQVDGTEFERTANIFDLKYVPDETSFEDDPVHDEVVEGTTEAAGPGYEGLEFVTDALRHSKVKLTWDADDPHRKSKMVNYLLAAQEGAGGSRRGKKVAGKEAREEDIRAYLASDSEDEEDQEVAEEQEEDEFFEPSAATGKAGKGDKRAKLRSLFGLDSGASSGKSGQVWEDKLTKQGGMQITFAPALRDQGVDAEEVGGKEETALETYKRKEKERKERKRAERLARREGAAGGAAAGEEKAKAGKKDKNAVAPKIAEDAGFDDEFFAGADEEDMFAAYDKGEMDLDEGGKKAKKLSKKERREAKEAEEAAAKASAAGLELLVASDSEEDDTVAGKHFDMRAILKAEKQKGKKKLPKALAARKRKNPEGPQELVKDDFKLDLKDERFKGVHEDVDFAIDPSNPKFQKTKNMSALLEEGRKRRKRDESSHERVSSSKKQRTSSGAAAAGAGAGEDGSAELKSLVESVKRQAGEKKSGKGKRE